MADSSDVPGTVHRLRALTLLLNDAGTGFAARHGLGTSEIRALICLLDQERAGEPASPTWLAGRLGMTTASVTGLLDRMAAAGHVRRSPRTDDRRRVDVVVTPAARRLGWSFFSPLIDATVAVLESRAPAERAAIDAFLDDLVRALDGLDRSGD